MARGARASFSYKDKDRGYEKIRRELEKAGQAGAFVKVGLIGDVKDRHEGDPVGAVELGLIHEFGAPAVGIPERSWLRSAVDKNRKEWEELRAHLVEGIYSGKMTIERALGIMGARAASDVKLNVTEGPEIPPPAMPETFLRKLEKGRGGGGEPRNLVDTGRMVDSVSWQVVLGGGDHGEDGGE